MSSIAYLIDTHVLFWMDEDSPRLSERLRALLFGSRNGVFCSISTLWEIAIKQSLGKLPFRHTFSDVLRVYGLTELSITTAHVEAVARLPLLHRDPFDRMLVAQAQVENLVLVTGDRQIQQYDVALLRC